MGLVHSMSSGLAPEYFLQKTFAIAETISFDFRETHKWQLS
jgi:hypothetical protein